MKTDTQTRTPVQQRSGSGGSLVDALQALTEDMSRAESDADAEQGLQRLAKLREDFQSPDASETALLEEARRSREALFDWVEERLRRLRRELEQKRRVQEGQFMEKLAREHEAAERTVLPGELIDAVIQIADVREPTEKRSSEAAKETKQKRQPRIAKPIPRKEPDKKEPEEQKTTGQSTSEPEKTPALPELPAQSEQPKWSKYHRLAAHLAASVQADPHFFERLRRAARRPGRRMPAPQDAQTAEKYYRSIHDLNKRLINLELHARAIAEAAAGGAPVGRLTNTAAKELKGFLKDFKACRAQIPEMAEEYDRLFGGWAGKLAGMKPEKGERILQACAAERQAEVKPEPEPQRAEPEPAAPVLQRNPE